jgi:hypothetical protein
MPVSSRNLVVWSARQDNMRAACKLTKLELRSAQGRSLMYYIYASGGTDHR